VVRLEARSGLPGVLMVMDVMEVWKAAGSGSQNSLRQKIIDEQFTQ
jgi:hypothetical protein